MIQLLDPLPLHKDPITMGITVTIWVEELDHRHRTVSMLWSLHRDLCCLRLQCVERDEFRVWRSREEDINRVVQRGKSVFCRGDCLYRVQPLIVAVQWDCKQTPSHLRQSANR